jgi:hypothetical protein
VGQKPNDQNFPFQVETKQYPLNFVCSWVKLKVIIVHGYTHILGQAIYFLSS